MYNEYHILSIRDFIAFPKNTTTYNYCVVRRTNNNFVMVMPIQQNNSTPENSHKRQVKVLVY